MHLCGIQPKNRDFTKGADPAIFLNLIYVLIKSIIRPPKTCVWMKQPRLLLSLISKPQLKTFFFYIKWSMWLDTEAKQRRCYSRERGF